MFKPKYTRRIPPGSEFKVLKGKKHVRIQTNKGWQWVPVSKGGLALMQHRLWHGRVRTAGGKIITVKLLSDRESSEIMLREKQHQEHLIQTGRALPASKSTETVAELVDRFEAEKQLEGVSQEYIITMWRRLRDAVRDLKWETIEDIRQAESVELSRWFTTKAKGAPGTKVKRLIIVEQFLKWLKAQDLIFRVPKMPKGSSVVVNKRRALTLEDVEKLATAAPWPRSLLYRLAFATLARRGALLSLRPEHFDFSNPANPNMILVPERAKTKRGQRVPIPTRLVPDLMRLILDAKGRVVFWKTATLNMSNTFKADLKRAGIPEKTEEGFAVFHSLRHSGATHLVKSGVSLLLVKEMGGWSSLTMLAKHYSHLSPISDRAAIDAAMASQPANLKIFGQP